MIARPSVYIDTSVSIVRVGVRKNIYWGRFRFPHGCGCTVHTYVRQWPAFNSRSAVVMSYETLKLLPNVGFRFGICMRNVCSIRKDLTYLSRTCVVSNESVVESADSYIAMPCLWHSGISFKHFWEVQRTYQLSQLPNFFLLCPLSTIFPQQCCKRSRYFGFASRKENVKLHPWCYFYILLTLRSVYWRLFLHVPIMFVGRHISWLVYDIIFICVFFFRH